MNFNTPQAAYRAGYVLVDPHVEETGIRTFRHVNAAGGGMVYTVPREAVDVEVMLNSHAHGDIYGALLSEVEAAATERRQIQ